MTRRIKALDTYLVRLETEIAAHIEADAGLSLHHAIQCSIPGVGALTSSAILAELAEIGTLSSKQTAALAGLAPMASDSGPRNGNRCIRGGRPELRKSLYMAALAASRYNPDLKIFYRRLTAAGKAPKLALAAVARKLLITANRLIADEGLWSPLPA